MSAIVSSIRKSENFSNEKPFVVIVFRKQTEQQSKIAVGALTEGGAYSLTYNLALIFPDVVTDEGECNAKEAYKKFKELISVGSVEPVNCYDIPLSEISEFEAVQIVASGRVMQTMRPAVYGSRDDALRVAKNSLERQLRQKTIKPVNLADGADDDDDDDDE